MRTMMLTVAMMSIGCLPICAGGPQEQAPAKNGHPAHLQDAYVNPTDIAGLPRVLLIGDSISEGYTVPVRRLLDGKANVHRIPVNGQATDYGLANLKTWLGTGKWDVIHFNWGLWDICYRNPEAKTQGHRDKVNGKLSVIPAQYRENIEKILGILKQTGARLVWCSTTPVPANEIGRIQGDELKYNAIAADIMTKNGIAIDDLYAHALKKGSSAYIEAGNVHFSEAGYDYLAEAVAASIAKVMSK